MIRWHDTMAWHHHTIIPQAPCSCRRGILLPWRHRRHHDAAKCTRLGGQKTAQTRMVFLMQKTLCKNTSHPWGLFVEVFFLKNTSTKNTSHPWGVFVEVLFLKEHFNKNTSHPWGVFVDRTFPLQKDFTPVGSFCRSVLQEKYGQQKDPTGVKCFSRTKTPSQYDFSCSKSHI